MRVITGIARGRKLKTPEGIDIRPTAERAKEAIFSMIQCDLPQSIFLDLFCGCGQMGIEALSRGAKKAIFVDNNRISQELTKENLIAVKLFSQSNVVLQDAKSFLTGGTEKYDIAFLDPPYALGIFEGVLPLLAKRMNCNGIIILETQRSEIVPETIDSSAFILAKQTNYGIAKISVFKIPT